MNMVPAQNLFEQEYYNHGYSLMNRIEGYDLCSEEYLRSDLVVVGHMAEEELRISSLNEEGSSSKDVQEGRDEEWLQLGISVAGRADLKLDYGEPTTRRGGLVEIDLLNPGDTGAHVKPFVPIFGKAEFLAPRPNSITPLLLQHPGLSLSFPQPENTWGYMPNTWNSSPSCPSSFSMPPTAYDVRHVTGPSSDVRVVDAPLRPHSGVWFVLQASNNQAKEPFLPQIPKSFLRIKDGRITVRLLMKYLVNKLRLDSESEVEIRCRGQQLLPFLTLQHVRDNIWSSRDAVTSLTESSTTEHVMILHYGRT